MNKTFAFLAAALLLLSSCKKETSDGSTFTATIDNCLSSKTTLTDNGSTTSVNWETDDEININGVNYCVSDISNSTATFVPNDGGYGCEAADTYEAYYPKWIVWSSSGSHVPKLPNVLYSGWLPGKYLPMYGKATGRSRHLTFYNICAVLKINVQTPFYTLEVSSDAYLSGEFDIGQDAAGHFMAVTGNRTTDDAHKKITLRDRNSVQVAAGTYYIAVPARSYANQNLTIKVDNVSYPARDQNITLEVSKIYNITLSGSKAKDRSWSIL